MSDSEHADCSPTVNDVREIYIGQQELTWDKDAEFHGAAFDRMIAALASTPSPAQTTEASERPAEFMAENDTHWSNGEAKNWLIDDDIAPSPVQGADDRLAQAEAVIAEARSFHGDRPQDSLWGIRGILAAYPSHAALDEVRAQAFSAGANWMEDQHGGGYCQLDPVPDAEIAAASTEYRTKSSGLDT